MNKHTPVVGDRIKLDTWGFPERLLEGDDPVGEGYPGCQFRVEPFNVAITLAVNVKVTGGYHSNTCGGWRSRCKIEFVGDCEPSTFAGGWIYHGGVR